MYTRVFLFYAVCAFAYFVVFPLVFGFFASGEYEVDYDSEPAFEAETTDTTLKLKIGYKW